MDFEKKNNSIVMEFFESDGKRMARVLTLTKGPSGFTRHFQSFPVEDNSFCIGQEVNILGVLSPNGTPTTKKELVAVDEAKFGDKNSQQKRINNLAKAWQASYNPDQIEEFAKNARERDKKSSEYSKSEYAVNPNVSDDEWAQYALGTSLGIYDDFEKAMSQVATENYPGKQFINSVNSVVYVLEGKVPNSLENYAHQKDAAIVQGLHNFPFDDFDKSSGDIASAKQTVADVAEQADSYISGYASAMYGVINSKPEMEQTIDASANAPYEVTETEMKAESEIKTSVLGKVKSAVMDGINWVKSGVEKVGDYVAGKDVMGR